ncbi:MAG: transcription termination/antitermination protein NusG [Candidatus Tritonobacter lacicola]|nr:transcription termination/antitermination protein NusG [Candidatus Tritonobacter lacicola]
MGDKKWYVVHTLSGHEQKVKEALDRRIEREDYGSLISRVLIPTENVSEVRAGKKTISSRKFFPGYVLVDMEITEESWHFVKSTQGVIGFVGGGKPQPLRDREIDSILFQIEEKKEKIKPKVLFEVGETVRVTDGPFVNFNGAVEEVNPEKGRLKVMVTIFGRATPVEFEYWQVERG